MYKTKLEASTVYAEIFVALNFCVIEIVMLVFEGFLGHFWRRDIS